MTSLAKINANRSNARKSTGPKTARGKSRSRFNAVKSGNYAVHRPLPSEDQKVYQHLARRLWKRYQPTDPVEELLVDQILGHIWRLGRLERAEKAYLNAIDKSLRLRQSRFDIKLDALYSREEDFIQCTSKTRLMANANLTLQNDHYKTEEIDDLGDVCLEASVPRDEKQLLVALVKQRSALIEEVLWMEERLQDQLRTSFHRFVAMSN